MIAITETWLPVVGYEGRHEVSSLGNVRSLPSRGGCQPGRILRPGVQSKGYLCVSLYDGSRPKKPRSYCVHDLVAWAFIGPKPPGLTVDHIDRNQVNNAAGNLRYATHVEQRSNQRPRMKRRIIRRHSKLISNNTGC